MQHSRGLSGRVFLSGYGKTSSPAGKVPAVPNSRSGGLDLVDVAARGRPELGSLCRRFYMFWSAGDPGSSSNRKMLGCPVPSSAYSSAAGRNMLWPVFLRAQASAAHSLALSLRPEASPLVV